MTSFSYLSFLEVFENFVFMKHKNANLSIAIFSSLCLAPVTRRWLTAHQMPNRGDEMPTNSTLGRVRPPDWAAESPVGRPALRKQSSPGFARVLIAFCIGIAATLAWQSYGDTARDIIVRRYPQLAWLTPQVPVMLPSPATIVPPIASSDSGELQTMSLGLAAVRQRVDQLTASQDKIARDITMTLQAVKQEILDKISVLAPQPATAAPARKPAPLLAAPSR
jgi:hypothetical protein